MVKRAFDFLSALFGLVLFSPLIVLLALFVRIETPGPGLFSQDRVGRHGRIFRCYKLRTMYRETPNVPTHVSSAGQITRLGKVLRTTKIDELPQLWNVLKGDMSLVGPRPCLPQQSELVSERKRRGVLDLRPGITGIAQVKGVDMSDPVRLAEVDAQYLHIKGVGTDVRLILETIFAAAVKRERINPG